MNMTFFPWEEIRDEGRSFAASGPAGPSSPAHITLEIVDLPADQLGRAVGISWVQIDVDAAGFGWFSDTTPWDDVEFTRHPAAAGWAALPGSEARERVDLLTVVLHELGHLLGYDHQNQGFMDDALPLGTRRLPDQPFSDLGQAPYDELEDRYDLSDPTAIDPNYIDKVFAAFGSTQEPKPS